MSFDPGAPPLISETLLKSRRTLEELAHKRSVTVKTQNKVCYLFLRFLIPLFVSKRSHYSFMVSPTFLLQRRRIVRGEDVRIKRPEQFVREFRIVSYTSPFAVGIILKSHELLFLR